MSRSFARRYTHLIPQFPSYRQPNLPHGFYTTHLFSTSTPVSILLPAQFYAGAFKSQTPPMHANLERRAAKRAAVKNAPFVNGHENSYRRDPRLYAWVLFSKNQNDSC
ncbi:hypothetical protein OIDMADRAFT_16984 [Oidiodendron maius Zn]|uniref:Uncharacterized protein n=1 Tax=Oidiodendron maius (strain Zn) TaxID=913774 RepID=A0A0C3HBU1_OIDMZ|nr:hypothetical protein OIDMADRAFT_16984 [Oidiodendron maius Zn]